jgi:ATP-dependent Clp protease ATP-binding subunit ClpA
MIFSRPSNEGQSKPGAGDIFAPTGELRAEVLAPATLSALKESIRWAMHTCWDSLRTPHLFMGLISQPDALVQSWGDKVGADLPALLTQFAEIFHQDHLTPFRLRLHREFLSDNVIELLRRAWQRCLSVSRCHIRPVDLLVITFQHPDNIVANCFQEIGFSAKDMAQFALEIERQLGKP